MNDERTASVLVIKKKTQVLASLTADYKWFVFFIPFTVIDIITEEFLYHSCENKSLIIKTAL